MGMPPTGKEITITELAFDRFADGKLVKHRVEADMLGPHAAVRRDPFTGYDVVPVVSG